MKSKIITSIFIDCNEIVTTVIHIKKYTIVLEYLNILDIFRVYFSDLLANRLSLNSINSIYSKLSIHQSTFETELEM